MSNLEMQNNNNPNTQFRCGYVALAGRPNVGKSSLLNALLETRLSIISPKAQTTRHRILGINNRPEAQILYLDLPGIHQAKQYKQLNRVINKTALQSSSDADVLLLVVQADKWTKDDEAVLRHLKALNVPIIAVINKIDLYKSREQVLPFITKLHSLHDFAEIIPVSALKKLNVSHLEDELIKYLPEQDAFYGPDEITDRSERFYVTEIIRETLFYKLQQELPYGVEVMIVDWDDGETKTHLEVDIWIAKASYKPILLGKKGTKLAEIRKNAEKKVSDFLQREVKLHFRLKLVKDWSTHAKLLQELGYEINS
ncbi:MAG: GTPase Era [Gammaproteobacteria bacterium]|nr:GTPase Era [Gammaproteobacteria bacterium]NNC96553.1 GTPase Era [Gammaproteobacteria bacterium]NNM12912.1 GTPase Era [Gammaproteobacteria bacterium]